MATYTGSIDSIAGQAWGQTFAGPGQWATKKGEAGIQDYWKEKNQRSIDGKPTNIIEDLIEDGPDK